MTNNGDIPEGWATCSLSDIVAIAIGGEWGASPESVNGKDSVLASVIRGTEFRDWDRNKGLTAAIRAVAVRKLESRQLVKGDLVLEVSGGGPHQPVGRTALIDDEALNRSKYPLTCSNFCRKISLVPLVSAPYCWWQLRFQHATGVFDAFQTQTTNLRNLNVTDFLNGTRLTLPPLAEQRRIVAKVEELLARVNAARQRLAKAPPLLKRFRQSVLAAACSGQLTADWRETNHPKEDGHAILKSFQADRKKRLPKRKPVSDVTDIPFTLPDTWAWGQWNDLVDWITYGFTRPMPHVGKGIPIVTAKNIVGSRIRFDDLDYTTPAAYDELSDKDRPREGEILMTKDGSIGRAAIVNGVETFCINQSVAVLRFGGPTAYVPYLLRVIESPFTQSLIDEGAKGSAIRHISITAFAAFPCPLPPLTEQQEIVRRVDALFALADKIEARVQAATARVEKITQAILAKAFRGELVPTEGELARRESRAYEPASALLKRIRAERITAAGANGAPNRRRNVAQSGPERVEPSSKPGNPRKQRTSQKRKT